MNQQPIAWLMLLLVVLVLVALGIYGFQGGLPKDPEERRKTIKLIVIFGGAFFLITLLPFIVKFTGREIRLPLLTERWSPYLLFGFLWTLGGLAYLIFWDKERG